jgi:RNA polymerase sigma-70 factor (ECF subfamily)
MISSGKTAATEHGIANFLPAGIGWSDVPNPLTTQVSVITHDFQKGWSDVPNPLTTQVLIEQVQQGDRNALNELCNRYLMRVLAAVRVRLGAPLRRKLDSWDIVQEVMIEALRKVQSFDFRTEGAFLKYLNRVVENRIRDEADRWRAQKRDAGKEIPLGAEGSSSGPNPLKSLADRAAPTPSRIVGLHEDLALLERAMDRLAEESQEYRDLIVAVKIEGCTYEEIARETGKSPDAVRMKVNRAMAALITVFQNLEVQGPLTDEIRTSLH